VVDPSFKIWSARYKSKVLPPWTVSSSHEMEEAPPLTFIYLFIYLSAGDVTQSLTHARKVLYL
jgi:hypothetical protein